MNLLCNSPRQREVFRMSRELHMSNREIAEHFSITEKSNRAPYQSGPEIPQKEPQFIHVVYGSLTSNQDSVIAPAIRPQSLIHLYYSDQSIRPLSHC